MNAAAWPFQECNNSEPAVRLEVGDLVFHMEIRHVAALVQCVMGIFCTAVHDDDDHCEFEHWRHLP